MDWKVIPSHQASSGVLVVWNKEKVEVHDYEQGSFSQSIHGGFVDRGDEWVFFGVYDQSVMGIFMIFLESWTMLKLDAISRGASEGISIVSYTPMKEKGNHEDPIV